MDWLSLALLALVTSAPPFATPAVKRPPPARVYVFAAQPAANSPPEEQQGLLDSVRDLSASLPRSEFVAATAAEAEVRVEILNREERSPSEGGFGGQSLTRFRQTIVRFRVETVDANGELKGIGQGSWKAAAKDAAERLSKWLKSHPVARNDGKT